MTLNPALDAGPSPLASARHLALPGPRRAGLEGRIRTAAHRSTGDRDVKRPLPFAPTVHRDVKRLGGLAVGIVALGALLVVGIAGTVGALLLAAG
ncbi:hypothetical protein [Zhihengliuella halotolerans]|uniref:Uncharacterized protein n=1 Tax=Zhihengliuella halotolerans TaxID=370736 RepID=A0A4Q8AHJ2_9MICC|nr:hypothetical protein [Zhihengliuella halotolerans]RZU63243.1 hypothetical protein EV380_2855 [Zhihengliuella halotolerans]